MDYQGILSGAQMLKMEWLSPSTSSTRVGEMYFVAADVWNSSGARVFKRQVGKQQRRWDGIRCYHQPNDGMESQKGLEPKDKDTVFIVDSVRL